MEQGRRALVKELCANLYHRKNLTCYVRGRWVPFGEKAISQLLGHKTVGDCTAYEQLQKSPNFEEIIRELTDGQRKWKRIKTISNAYLNRGDLNEISKVWLYFINSIFKPSKHVSTVRQDHALPLYALVKGFTLSVGKIIQESILDYV